MITLYLLAGVLGQSEASATGTSAPVSARRRQRRRLAQEYIDKLIDVLDRQAERENIVETPEPVIPKPGRKKKRAIAKKIIVAAGESDLLPFVPQFSNELEQIGQAAYEAMALPDLAAAQDRYSQIVALIEEMARIKAIEDEQDETDFEELLLAA